MAAHRSRTIPVKNLTFVAHSSSATCLRFGQKSGRVMVTGGEDRRVNLWTVGSTTPVMSLQGHVSSVECVTLDWPEEVVIAGSASGSIKLWDLEHAKVIRTLTGHKAACKSVEFHPFGDFFASGSADHSVKIWDVRRKGCLHSFAGHEGSIDVVKITPDGRWVVSGGRDATVKVYDMTAGKLLKSFSDHTGPITALAFNPGEIMGVSASADGTVRVYDLQTFEIIGVVPAILEARDIAEYLRDSEVYRGGGMDRGIPLAVEFHPEGPALVVGYSHQLEVWSYEPTLLCGSVQVNWPTLADMQVFRAGEIIGGTLDRNFAGLYSIDIGPFDAISPAASISPISKPSSQQQSVGTKPDAIDSSVSVARMSGSSDHLAGAKAKAMAVEGQQTARLIKGEKGNVKDFSESHIDIQAGDLQDKSGYGGPYPSHSKQNTPITPVDALGNPLSPNHARPLWREPSLSSLSLYTEGSTPDGGNIGRQAARIDDTSTSSSSERPRSSGGSPPKTNIVPASNGEAPLNLDLARFVATGRRSSPEYGGRGLRRKASSLSMQVDPYLSPDASPTDSEYDLAEHLLFRHTSMMSILSNRLSSLRSVRSAWEASVASGAHVKGAVQVLAEIGDPASWLDVLRVINLKPRLLTLDCAMTILPALKDLIYEGYEDYITTACTTLRILSKSFSTVVLTTTQAGNDQRFRSGAGLDLNGEERLEKCRSCLRGFHDAIEALDTLRVNSGPLSLLLRDTRRDLDVFIGDTR
ncbi:WD40-repeat-containing domain protein [Cladochytrium replicatum]|nr:WD40-repeat-containing domain protein [Cladochytrium replicatum]